MPAIFTIKGEIYTGKNLTQVGTSAIAPYTGITGATIAQLTFERSAIRYYLNGDPPTSASGHLIQAGDILTLMGGDVISGFRTISPNDTGTIQASFGN